MHLEKNNGELWSRIENQDKMFEEQNKQIKMMMSYIQE
jgi:hypothetical protein